MSESLHPEESVTTFLLIRHGHTSQTETGKLYSDPASTLTDKGQAQAQAIAQWLPAEAPEVLLTSPSLRVRATADAIGQCSGAQPIILTDLFEWQVGDWEGRSYYQIKKEEPDAYAAWSKDPIRHAPPNGESIEQLCERAIVQIQVIQAQYAGKKVALVSHAEVIRAILVHALGMPVDNFWRLNVPTASVTKVDFSPSFATVHYLALRPELFVPAYVASSAT